MSTHIPGSGKKAPFIRKLEVSDVRIIGVEFSGDGEAWADYQHTFGSGGQSQGGFPQLLDLLQNGERILCRTIYADIYKNGSTGVPKTGPIYELKLLEVQPVRQIIAAEALQQLPERIAPGGRPADQSTTEKKEGDE